MKCARSIRAAVAAASLMLAALAVLWLASPATASEQVPFNGRLEAAVTRSPISPTVVSVVLDGGGNADHLGRFTFTAPHVVDTVTRLAAGSYQFTAANGDTVSASFVGQAMPTATPGVIYIVETATITGGTGRFAGATGSFIVERLYDTLNGTTVGSFTGTISSPGSNGH